MAGTRWIPWDLGYFHNPKARAAGKNGRALHLASTCWSADNLQDGKVPASILTLLCSLAEVPLSTAKRLVEVGLWTPLDDGSGWEIHDFLVHNKSRADVEKERSKWARKKAHQRGMSPGDSPGDTNGHVTECPPGSPPYKTETDRQTDTTSSYVSTETDDSLPGQPPSSSWKSAHKVAHQLARHQAKDRPPDDFDAWLPATVRGILKEKHAAIDTALGTFNGDIDAVVNSLRRRNGEQKQQRQAWYADPRCRLCAGSGVSLDDDDPTRYGPCDCRRDEPYGEHKNALRSVK